LKIAAPEGKPIPEEELPFNQVMKSKEPVHGVACAIEKPDGTRIELSVNASPLLDENGKIESVVLSITDITEQRRTAEEISESRRQVLDILESITDAFYALDNDWRFTYVNHRAEELFRIRREQLLFRNIWEVIRKEQSPEIYENYTKAKEQIAPVVFEDFSPRLNKWLEMHVFPYENGVSVYIKDVTERKQAEEERAVNLHYFESVDRANRAILGADNLEQMMGDVLDVVLKIFDCDRAGLVYPCDPEASSWSIPMERDKPEWPGVNVLGIEVPMDPEVSRVMRMVMSTDKPVGFGPGNEKPLPVTEVSIRFHVRSQMATAFYPKIGKPWMFVINQCSYPRVWTQEEKRLFEETGRRLADGLTSLLTYQEMRKSEQKYYDLFKDSPEGIFITAPDGRILDVNNKILEIYGYDTKEEVLRLDLARDVYADPEDRKRVLETVNREGSGEFDIPEKKKSGEIIIVHISLKAITDESGNITSYRGLVRDVTEKNKAEEIIK
jgi:PAS domain S-box-containing protein